MFASPGDSSDDQLAAARKAGDLTDATGAVASMLEDMTGQVIRAACVPRVRPADCMIDAVMDRSARP
jgi:hypothetical protein